MHLLIVWVKLVECEKLILSNANPGVLTFREVKMISRGLLVLVYKREHFSFLDEGGYFLPMMTGPMLTFVGHTNFCHEDDTCFESQHLKGLSFRLLLL